MKRKPVVKYPTDSEALILLVERDRELGLVLTDWLRRRRVACVLAGSAAEAQHLLDDAVILDLAFDGLLLDFHLPEVPGYRVASAFRHEFPDRPVALAIEQDELCLQLWAQAREVPVFRRVALPSVLTAWIGKVKAAAAKRNACLAAG